MSHVSDLSKFANHSQSYQFSKPVPTISHDTVGLVFMESPELEDVPDSAIEQRFMQDGLPSISMFEPPETQDVINRLGKAGLRRLLLDAKDDVVFGDLVEIYGPDRFDRSQNSREWLVKASWGTADRAREELGYNRTDDYNVVVGFDGGGVQGIAKTGTDDVSFLSYNFPKFK